jgi:hypothetical protein
MTGERTERSGESEVSRWLLNPAFDFFPPRPDLIACRAISRDLPNAAKLVRCVGTPLPRRVGVLTCGVRRG